MGGMTSLAQNSFVDRQKSLTSLGSMIFLVVFVSVPDVSFKSASSRDFVIVVDGGCNAAHLAPGENASHSSTSAAEDSNSE